MGSANTWVVSKNSSRSTLRDQGQDQDRKKSVSSGLETKTAVSRTTRLVSCEWLIMFIIVSHAAQLCVLPIMSGKQNEINVLTQSTSLVWPRMRQLMMIYVVAALCTHIVQYSACELWTKLFDKAIFSVHAIYAVPSDVSAQFRHVRGDVFVMFLCQTSACSKSIFGCTTPRLYGRAPGTEASCGPMYVKDQRLYVYERRWQSSACWCDVDAAQPSFHNYSTLSLCVRVCVSRQCVIYCCVGVSSSVKLKLTSELSDLILSVIQPQLNRLTSGPDWNEYV